MHYAISFKINMFNLTKEDENPINPIYGQSLILWLRDKAGGKVEIGEPDTEDWGWYTFVEWNGRPYLLGASAEESDEPELYWVLQLEKQRTLKEKLLDRGKMLESDECFQYFKSLLESEPEFHDVALA